MAFTPKTWQNKPSVSTPITAEDLNRMEAGIVEGTQAASEVQAGNVELASSAEMNTGTDLTRAPSVKRVVDWVTAHVNTAIGSVPAASPASETAAGIVELASSAEMTAGTDLTRTPSVKRVYDYVSAAIAAAVASLTSSTNAALSTKANIAGSITQFSDIEDAVPADGDILRYDTALGQYLALDPSAQFAEVGADGRIVASARPQFYVPALIINEGGTVPGTFPSGGIVFTRPSGGGGVVVPANIGQNVRVNNNNVVVTTTQALAVGDYLVIGLATSGEDSPGVAPVVTISAGAAAQTLIASITNGTTVRTTLLQGRVTTAIPAGSTVTITLGQTTGRTIAMLLQIPGLVTSSVVDVSITTTGNSNSTLAKTMGPTSAMAIANEIAVQAYGFNAGSVTGGNVRTFDSSSGWIGLGTLVTADGASDRGLHVGYKVLSAIGTVTGNAQITAQDGTSGAWSGVLATFKKA